MLNPFGKAGYALARMVLFCNKICKFTLVLTMKRMKEYKIYISGFEMNLYHYLNDFEYVFLKNMDIILMKV
jgi:hypothetical protein